MNKTRITAVVVLLFLFGLCGYMVKVNHDKEKTLETKVEEIRKNSPYHIVDDTSIPPVHRDPSVPSGEK